MYTAELKIIVTEIINSGTVSQGVAAVKKLSELFTAIAAEATYKLSADNEKNIAGGQALSSYHAAVCTDDYLRTCYFIKGTFRALIALRDKFPGKKIHVLYAGCGPYATLLLPLLPLFNPDAIDAILLDINSSSLQFVDTLLSFLNLNNYTVTLIEADATVYQKQSSLGIDLFISETMHYALTAEPQVAITKNFIPQLLPHTICIPNQIHIDMVYTAFGREPFIKSGSDSDNLRKDNPEPKRYYAGRLFTISKNAAYLLEKTSIKTPFYPVPDDITSYPDLCIFTEVNVYDDITLKTAQSVITNPYCITSLYHIKAHHEFQLEYNYSQTPKWALHFKS